MTVGLRSQVWCRKNGVLVATGQNLVVSAGLALLSNRMVGDSAPPPGYMAIGTSGVVTTSDMTALTAEVERVSLSTSVNNGAIWTVTATFGSGIGSRQLVQEYGLFNAAAGGTMFNRFLSSVVSLDPGDEYVVTWAINFEYLALAEE